MKVLHISNDFSLTKVHSNLYKSLDDKNIRQIVFNPVRINTPVGNNLVDFQSQESTIIYSKKLKKYHRYLFRFKIDFLYKDLISKVDVKSLKITHATTLFSDGALALKIKEKHHVPYIVAVRATDINVFLKYRPDLVNMAIRILCNAEKIIFIGDSLKKRFLEHKHIRKYADLLDSNSKIIYNGIDDFWLDDILPKKNCEPIKILYVGRFVNRKNIPKLIESILSLNTKGYKIELNLVGTGGVHENLIKHIATNNEGVINFLGQIKDKSKLQQIYRDNHIFAMPSQGETFGLVYLEALSQGLPVLGSKEEGIHNTFDINIGEFIDLDSIDSIENGLRKIIRCYQKYELEKIDFNLFRWNNIAEVYLELYKNECP